MELKKPSLDFHKIWISIKNFFRHMKNSSRRIYNQIVVAVKLFYRSPVSALFMILFPIVLLLLFGAIFSPIDDYQFRLEIQDNDNTALSANFIQDLRETNLLDVRTLSSAVDPKVYMQQNGLHACLVIPPGWTSDTFNPAIRTANITLILDPYSEGGRVITDIVSNKLDEFNFYLNDSSPIVGVTTESFVSETGSYINFLLPGIIGVTIMNVGILGTINRQSYFKKSGIYAKLATTPITRAEYVISEIIWQSTIAFIATVIIIFMAWLIFNFSWYSFSIMIIPIVMVGVTMFSGIGLLISLIVKDVEMTLAIGTLVTMPLLFLSGVFFDISGVPVLLVISKFSPLTFIVDSLRAAMITKNFALAWGNMGIAMLLALAAFIPGTILTRWNEDKPLVVPKEGLKSKSKEV